MRRMREDWRALGSLAHVPDVWRHALLRQFAEPAREQTRARERASGHRVSAAKRALVILLSGRRILRILNRSHGPVGRFPNVENSG
jgi:hypothetical protein